MCRTIPDPTWVPSIIGIGKTESDIVPSPNIEYKLHPQPNNS